MGKFRKAIATISMVAILSSLVVTTTAFAAYDDVSADHWAYDAVTALEADGTLSPADTLRVNDPINRAEMMKIIVGAGGLVGDVLCSSTFDDVASTDWFDEVCGVAYQNDIFRGNDSGVMMPGANINRADLSVVLHRAVGGGSEYKGADHFNDVSEGVYYDDAAGWARCYGVVSGYADGSFGPGREATRGEALVMVYRAFGDLELDAACTAEEVVEEEVVEEEVVEEVVSENAGDMTVTLSDETATGATLPELSTSVSVATWDFTPSGGEDATLQSLQIHRFGVSTLPSDHQVYLYDGNDRLTSGKSVNSSTNLVTFNNLNIDIDDDETKSLTLRLDVGDVTNTGELGFEIASADAVGSDGEVTGSFPLAGAVFATSTTPAGNVTIEKNGTITNPKVGEDDVVVAKFKMSGAVEEANLEQIGLYVTGTIATDAIQNFELYVSGQDEAVATVESLNSKDLATFVFEEPYVLAKGDTKSFTVKADFNTGRTGDTIQIYVDETTDIVAIGSSYGYGMQVVITGASGYDAVTEACTSSAGTCSYSALEGGDVTITSSGPTAGDIAIGGDDVVLMDFSMASVSDVTVKNFPVAFTVSESVAAEGLLNATTANFTDIKVVNADTGETLMGPIDADVLTTGLANSTAIHEDTADTDGAIAYYLFTDEFDMEAGSELNLQITTDVANATALDTVTILTTLDLGNGSNTYPQMRDVNNKTVTNTSSLVPTSDIVGKTMTIGSPSLTTALAAVPVAGGTTHVKGEKNVKFVGVSTRCGSASDCKVTDITVNGYISDNDDTTFVVGSETIALNTHVGSVWLVDSDGNEVAPSKSVPTGGVVAFSDLAWDLDAGETQVFYVVGDISTNAPAADHLAFSVATAELSFEDDDGNSRTSTGAVNGTTSPTTYVTTSDGGGLTVAVSPSTPNENIVVSGAADQEISKFKFTTTDEAYLVKKLSINARQSGVTTLGDYDNNVASIKISYVNSEGVTETKTGSLTSGTAQFSGLDMYVGKDDQATLTVYATVSSIDDSQATAGEYIDLNLAFNNFDSVAQSSGTTYKADKLDRDVSATSDLDIGTISFTDPNDFVLDGAVATVAAGSSITFTVDDGNGAITGVPVLPVGTIVCFDASVTEDADDDGGNAGTCDQTTDATDSMVIVTSYTAGTDEHTYTGFVIQDEDAALATNLVALYALPGTGYLTAANRVVVYNTLPALTLDADSPTGARTVNAEDTIMKFNVIPASSDDITIRQGLAGDDENDGVGINAAFDAVFTTTTTAGDFVDGTSGLNWVGHNDTVADNDCFMFDENYTAGGAGTVGLGNNQYMSFWIKTDEVDIPYNDFSVILDATTVAQGSCSALADAGDELRLVSTNSVWVNGTAMTSDTQIIGGGTADVWELVTIDISDITSDTTVTAAGMQIDATDALVFAATDNVYIDGLVFHNEMLVVDVASNEKLDLTPTTIVDCTLKEGTKVVASSAMAVSTISQARVLLVPTDNISGTDYNDIEIPRTVGKTFSLVCDTADLVDQTDNDDLLSPSIDFGSSSDGTVTRGDFWWSADEASRTLVYWLGSANTKLSGSALKY